MKGSYDDILSRIADPVLWHDENGAPRFAPFAPALRADPVTGETALVEVACRACRRAFRVCCSRAQAVDGAASSVAQEIRAGNAALYGAPPCHTTELERATGMDGCAAGEAMPSVAVQVLEYWCRMGDAWERDGALEGPFALDEAARRIAAGRW